MSKSKLYEIHEDRIAQRRAIQSVSNVASVFKSSRARAIEDSEVAAIVELLDDVGDALPVADIAMRLNWDSDKAAQAMARGGSQGVLVFFKHADQTMVVVK